MRTLWALILVVVAATPSSGQSRPHAAKLLAFDAYVARAVEDWSVPGLAIAVVGGDDLVFAKGYGVRELGRTEVVDVHTLFANASTTKAFTSMVTAMMVDEGRVAWDDRVVDHLETFRLRDPEATSYMTVRNLLSHRTGFGDPSHLWYGMPTQFDEMIRRVRFVAPDNGWTATYAYNNVTYATAGVIAGQAAGTDWETLVRHRILEPLQMSETVTNTAGADRAVNVATPHYVVDGELRPIDRYDLDNIGPAGVMYSSVSDMARWIRVLLDSTRIAGTRLVSGESFVEMFSPQTIIPLESFYPTARLTRPQYTAYGLGWFLQDYAGEKVAFHTGSIDGMSAIVGLVPNREIGVVVFANRDHAELRHALMFRAFDMLMEREARDWSAEMLVMYDSLDAESERRRATLIEDRADGTAPTLPLAEYAGTYVDSLFGEVTVALDGDGLVLSRSAFLTADLDHWHYDTFRAKWRTGWVTERTAMFQLDPNGKVTTLEIAGFSLERVESP